MANGAYETVRSVTNQAINAAEAAPSVGSPDKSFGRIVRSIEVKVSTLNTTNSPTAVTLRLYGHRTGAVLNVIGDIVCPLTSNVLTAPVPRIVFRDEYVEGVSVKVQSLTAGSSPEVDDLTVLVSEVDG